MAAAHPLVTAMLAAFGEAPPGQIVRFARRFAGERIGLAIERESSSSSQAVRFAHELLESDKLSDDLFNELLEMSPGYADLIEKARKEWLHEQGGTHWFRLLRSSLVDYAPSIRVIVLSVTGLWGLLLAAAFTGGGAPFASTTEWLRTDQISNPTLLIGGLFAVAIGPILVFAVRFDVVELIFTGVRGLFASVVRLFAFFGSRFAKLNPPSRRIEGQNPRVHQASKGDPWLDELDAALDAATALQPRPPQAWIDAAALLPSFDPRALPDVRQDKTAGDALIAMASLVDQEANGQWALKRDVRRDAISGMGLKRRLQRALSGASMLDRDDRYKLYRDLLSEICNVGQIEIDVRDSQDRLLAAQAIAEWFKTTTPPILNIDRLSVVLEARDKIEPLRKLVGKHFRGRQVELATLAASEGFGPEHKRILALTGVGGLGKSALIGRYVLSRLEEPRTKPFVYLDFDRTEIDPANHRNLIERIARNLGLIYAGLPTSQDFYELEAIAAGDMLEETLASFLPTGTEEELLIKLRWRLDSLSVDDFVVIFDTFEQVAVRGPEVTHRFAAFLELLLRMLPQARVVVSGRGNILLPLDMQPMQLMELDHESADAVLEARAVTDASTRERIIEVMGRSPLILKLAAETVNSGKLNLADLDRFESEARSTKVQGLLYTRILGHIRDPEIERLAHPGLVVRRVTPDIIRNVLAEICEIDPANAEELFARLPNQIDLFEPVRDPKPVPEDALEAGALQHRQDLREATLELMNDDPRWRDVLPEIHRRAAIYYQNRLDFVGRAEHLYHRVMLETDPEFLDTLWDEAVAPSLARSWREPIPVRARSWLGLRLGFDWNTQGTDLRLVDWEIRTAQVARERLRARDAAGALAALQERSERSSVSPLTELEVQALSDLGRSADALAAIHRALEENAKAPPAHILKLHLLAADTALLANQLDQARAHAIRAKDLANAGKDAMSSLRALEILSRTTQGREFARELERAFVEVPDRNLRLDESTAARVVRTIGGQSDAVLRKAALIFGDRPEQSLLSNDLGTWSSLFESVRKQHGGEQLLAAFAPRIGLTSTDNDTVRFATEVLRHDRRGEAIDTVLNAFGKDESILAKSRATFTVT